MSAAYERVARLCRHAPHLKPMALEALLHMPVGLLVQPEGPKVLAPCHFEVKASKLKAPTYGMTELMNVVFTDGDYFERFLPAHLLGLCTCRGMETRDLIAALLRDTHAPVVIDPGSQHALQFNPDELSAWTMLWNCAGPAPDPFDQGGCEFNEQPSHSQVLLDRLDVLMPSLKGVERSYVMQARPMGSSLAMRQALLVQCGDPALFERIRRALPLLGLGLTPDEAPQSLLWLSRHPGFERDVVAHMTPLYDRSAAQWRAPA